MAFGRKVRKEDQQAKKKYVLPSQHGDMPGMRQRDAQRAAHLEEPAPYGRYPNNAPRPAPPKKRRRKLGDQYIG